MFTSSTPSHGTRRNFDAAISTQTVELLRLYRLSHGLLIPDSLIAATASVAGVPFVSKNQRDTKFIVGLNLLAYP